MPRLVLRRLSPIRTKWVSASRDNARLCQKIVLAIATSSLVNLTFNAPIPRRLSAIKKSLPQHDHIIFCIYPYFQLTADNFNGSRSPRPDKMAGNDPSSSIHGDLVSLTPHVLERRAKFRILTACTEIAPPYPSRLNLPIPGHATG